MHLLLTVLEIILGELAVLLHLLELFDGIAAYVTHLNLAVLGDMGDVLGDLLTLILGERRENQAKNLTVVLRIDTHIGHLDRFFDRFE